MTAPAHDIAAALIEKLVEDRHWLHAHPELGFEEEETSAYVRRRLDALGVPYVAGIAGTGIIAEIKGRGDSPKVIGLRADMDALPLEEQTDVAYRSGNHGKMHACGHDGHTTMLLGVAEMLSQARDFDGTVRLIFQPAEENGNNGAERMLEGGVLERFPMDEVYALHNWPYLPVGWVGALSGPAMASGSIVEISLSGQGGHGALPHQASRLVQGLAQLILGIDGLVAQGRDAQDRIVATLPVLEGSGAFNILPDKVRTAGTVRCLDAAAEDRFERDLRALADGIAQAHGAAAEVNYRRMVPITTNAPGPTGMVAAEAAALGYMVATEKTHRPVMGSEDFSFFLDRVPGCYVWLGSGRGEGEEEPLHSPRYDFNDAAIPHGLRVLHAIVRRSLPMTN